MKLINETNCIEDKLEIVELDKRLNYQINKICKLIVSKAFGSAGWMFRYVTNSNRIDFTRSMKKSEGEQKRSNVTSPFAYPSKFSSGIKYSPLLVIQSTDDDAKTGKRADPKNPAGPVSRPQMNSLTANLNNETADLTLRSVQKLPTIEDMLIDENYRESIDGNDPINIFNSALEQAVREKREKLTQYQRMAERINTSHSVGEKDNSVRSAYEEGPAESNKS